jgi:hydrogenase expression/formation protein HypC
VSAPACDPHGHCITCSDEGVPMRVLELGGDGATCLDDQGVRHERIAVELVEPVVPGDQILVHAGVAIR